ncbi:MAG: phthiocerol/phenolphthiocerol synthesis type-I polyketide synthase [Acidobacteriota bacterium]|nr:phthiocerol/phenolphthiocerol synthesis type-I polyketide synthase [Acidobacteriota bacterium]
MTEQDLYNGLEIAVIGMSGRFPGARNLVAFWENLINGVESITFFSEKELIELGIDPATIINPNFVRTRGGFISDCDYFDAGFFGYTDGEAEVMTPQTRLFHECSWEALENAGYDPSLYSGSIGIYAGGRNSFDWEALTWLSGKGARLGGVLASTLCDKDSMTSRVSYNFNLRGPSFALNTACSTGLVAIHLACQALLSGECDMALAGASAITAHKPIGYFYHDGDIMSPDGHTRAFDARAAGLNYSDGVGTVLLKSLEEAVAGGDHIYAIIKGTAINNDGHNKVNYTAPSVKAQEKVIRAALCMAGIKAESVSYIEAHGTATNVGDPIEVQALKQAFASDEKHFCAIGSLKTNVGHMTEAAGIGGFIKTVLALKHRLIPPSLHYETPNPTADFENSPFYVCAKLTEWKRGQYPLRAGVSSFARGGTNAHIILEEASEEKVKNENEKNTTHGEYRLILLSARTSSALERMSENLVSYLQENQSIDIADAAYTLQVGRRAFEFRRRLTVSHIDEIIESLFRTNSREVRSGYTIAEDKPVVFMFPGLGSQYIGMGAGLYEAEPVFREKMNQCFEILKSRTGFDWQRVLFPHPSEIKNNLPDETVQPLLFSYEYALAQLLMAWGITPYMLIGYSFGEYTAACLSGVLSLEDALELIVSRALLISRVPGGAMLSVPLPVKEVQPILTKGLSIAIDNGPSCIVSGPAAEIENFGAQMKEMRHMCMGLDAIHAIHSMMMDPVVEEFKTQVGKYILHEPQIPYISNVTGKQITTEEAIDPGYWARHLRETVRFADGIHELLHEKKAIFVEVGPGRDLSTLMTRFIDFQSEQKVINLVRPPEKNVHDLRYLLNKIGDLWLYGKKIDWTGFYGAEIRQRVPLPTYPFQRKRYTIEPPREGMLSGIGMNFEIPRQDILESKVAVDGSLTQLPMMASYNVRSEIERVIVGIWQEMLGVNQIESDDDFLELGGDSLKAITVLSRVHKIYNTIIPLAQFFKEPTVKKLAEYIEKVEKSAFMPIPSAETKNYYVLSSIQMRLFILQQMDPDSVGYNLPQAYIMEGDIDRQKMETVFKKLIGRHESLRTSFEIIEKEPIQRINNAEDLDFEIEFVSGPGNKVDQFIQPFNLSRAPLIRARLIEQEPKKHILMVDMHHIVSDGVSNALFIQNFVEVYAGLELPPLKIQYKDYSEWLHSAVQMERLKQQEAFWLKELAGKLPILNLPTDFSRTSPLNFEGNRVYFDIPQENTEKLKELAKNEEATLYMVLLSIFNILLFKLSAQNEIIIGVDTAGRTHADFEQIIGVFINTLVLRTFPVREKPFRRFLQVVKAKTLEIFENQDYPFDLLVDKLEKTRTPFRNPIFDILFSYEQFEVKPLEIPEALSHLTIRPYDEGTVASKLDMNVKARAGDVIEIIIEYKTKLFKESTIRRYAGYFKEIVDAVILDSEIMLQDIKITHDLLRIDRDIGKLDLEF